MHLLAFFFLLLKAFWIFVGESLANSTRILVSNSSSVLRGSGYSGVIAYTAFLSSGHSLKRRIKSQDSILHQITETLPEIARCQVWRVRGPAYAWQAKPQKSVSELILQVSFNFLSTVGRCSILLEINPIQGSRIHRVHCFEVRNNFLLKEIHVSLAIHSFIFGFLLALLVLVWPINVQSESLTRAVDP